MGKTTAKPGTRFGVQYGKPAARKVEGGFKAIVRHESGHTTTLFLDLSGPKQYNMPGRVFPSREEALAAAAEYVAEARAQWTKREG